MTTQAHATSVQHEVVVDAPVERAFRVFTEQLDRIKPRGHTLLDAEVETTVLEPRAGGRIYDRAVDGSECDWATVLAYEPPDRLLFSWNIDPQWQIEPDPEKRSEVELRFVAETPDRTRVELEHRHIDRHGGGWEGTRDSVGSPEGWPLWLEGFAGIFTT
jgi:uncharacterized protein YndB with AHSA1/START domain